MKTETNETIPGEIKVLRTARPYTHRGERIAVGGTFECNSTEAYELLNRGYITQHFVDRDGTPYTGRVVAFELVSGGLCSVTREYDSYDRYDGWGRKWTMEPKFVKCELLKPLNLFGVGILSAGTKVRLRYEYVRELQHLFIDTPERSPNATGHFDPVFLIHESRGKPAVTQEEIEAREAIIAKNLAKRDSWMAATFAQA
jgi:hypothetical protein